MTDEDLRREFLDELCVKFMRLDNDWDFGNEIDDDVKEILDLCKRYLEEKGLGQQRDSN